MQKRKFMSTIHQCTVALSGQQANLQRSAKTFFLSLITVRTPDLLNVLPDVLPLYLVTVPYNLPYLTHNYPNKTLT